MNEWPRRSDLQRMVPAERAIFDAVQAVEAAGADVRLTDAVVLLQAARESVSDFVDGVERRRFVREETTAPGPASDVVTPSLKLVAPPPDPSACTHPDFRSFVNVGRFEDTGRFLAEVLIYCATCGSPFRFLGVPAGIHWERPAASIDSLELRAPIEPEGEKRLQERASFHMPEIPPRH
jgi:hypothetical protein